MRGGSKPHNRHAAPGPRLYYNSMVVTVGACWISNSTPRENTRRRTRESPSHHIEHFGGPRLEGIHSERGKGRRAPDSGGSRRQNQLEPEATTDADEADTPVADEADAATEETTEEQDSGIIVA